MFWMFLWVAVFGCLYWMIGDGSKGPINSSTTNSPSYDGMTETDDYDYWEQEVEERRNRSDND